MTPEFRDGFVLGICATAYVVAVVPNLVRQLRASIAARRQKPLPVVPVVPTWSNTWLHPHHHVVRLYDSLDALENDVKQLVVARRDARGGTDGR